jgi:hypothetical protein
MPKAMPMVQGERARALPRERQKRLVARYQTPAASMGRGEDELPEAGEEPEGGGGVVAQRDYGHEHAGSEGGEELLDGLAKHFVRET